MGGKVRKGGEGKGRRLRRGEGRESKGGDAQGLVHTPMFKILKNTLFHRDNGKHFALNITKSVLLDDHSDIFFTIFSHRFVVAVTSF